MTHKVDNAHSVDEETNASPFEDESPIEALNGNRDNTGSRLKLSLQADEDIEDVIMKLSSTNLNIRRSPVRGSQPNDQYDKQNLDTEQLQNDAKENYNVHKDGSRTHIPSGLQPISIPELAIFEKKHKGENIIEEIAVGTKVDGAIQSEDQKFRNSSGEHKEVIDNLVLVSSKSFVGETSTAAVEETSTVPTVNATNTESLRTVSKSLPTTAYDLASFYHTPVPKPLKKEKILTFCTKEVAIRDNRNMVIACGGDQDVWQPSRCPPGADCLLSQDSTYRLCCPVFKG
ncbi:hypothetical protein ANCDUO_00045 [Ancylostoma duodenale]|uniref:Uncharacterized protein n=1 Tax=Ancylostoma duodenale TaxID=51022 RepID=A0A0C2HJ34_9BILA|nr:hypothetical protein ANCDUO_00045 [Ancylostoma duodenale]